MRRQLKEGMFFLEGNPDGFQPRAAHKHQLAERVPWMEGSWEVWMGKAGLMDSLQLFSLQRVQITENPLFPHLILK